MKPYVIPSFTNEEIIRHGLSEAIRGLRYPIHMHLTDILKTLKNILGYQLKEDGTYRVANVFISECFKYQGYDMFIISHNGATTFNIVGTKNYYGNNIGV